jgi:hypothetical protein
VCIMVIHATSHTGNAIQAMAHNADTLTRDLAQLHTLLEGRGDKEGASVVLSQKRAQAAIAEAMWREWRNHISTGHDAQPFGEEAVSPMQAAIESDHSDVLGEPLSDDEVKQEVQEIEDMHKEPIDEAGDLEERTYEEQVVRDA